MNALKYCFFFFSIAISTSLEAAVEHFRSRADIYNPPYRNEICIEDDRFKYMKQNGGAGGSWTSEFINHKVSNRVYLGTDDALLLTTVPNYQIFVELEIKSYDLNDNVVNTQIVTLDVNYSNDPNQTEKNIHFFEFSGYHKFVTKILGYKDENGESTSGVVNLYIENEIIVERYYAFDPSISYGSEDLNLDHRLEDTDGDGNMDEAIIYWEHLSGAEEYDLEWTFIDNYKPSGEVLMANQVEFVARDFDLNATRISTSQTYYKIPLVFDKGYVLYRLRPKGYVLSELDQMMLGRWSTSGVENTASHVADFVNYFSIHQTQDEHEKEKNWQYSATYAEDGKRKDLVNYYDATLRNRQTVSRINSLSKAVVLESFYNHNGQLSIQSLPTPVEKPTIKYYEAFNRDSYTNEPYNWTLFDVPNPTECIANAKPFLAGQGSAKYYGESPPQGDYHDYVADAEGFPFTQTQYTPDLTGRIMKQAGVGKTFSMGNERETQYFYAQPFQEELDRLFGYEAGYKSRYKKNMVIDPNGQVSISYLDERGQVIATALAGAKPSNLQVVADEFGRDISPAIQRLNIDLLNKDQANDPDDAEDDNNLLSTGRFGALKDALQFSSQIAVESNNSLYDFKYDLSFGAYSDQCISPRCYPFVYDLLISLKDICGKEQFSYNGIEENLLQETIYNIDPINHNCNHPQSFSKTAIDGLTKDLDIGTYTLSKQLSINEEALTVYTDAYIQDGQADGCIRTFEDFLEEEMALVDISNCEITCESCVESLGDNDGSSEWQALYNECMQPCTPTSICEATLQTLLADVSPYGQYGSVDTMSNEFMLSVYNPNNFLPAEDTLWRNPVDYLGEAASYTDEQGNDFFILLIPDPNNSNYIPQVSDLSRVITNDDGQSVVAPQHLKSFLDFVIYWQPHWAENLVYYHPEFCYMDWCWETEKVWEGENYSSQDFDFAMQAIETYSDATQGDVNGAEIDFISPLLYLSDPLYRTRHPGLNRLSTGAHIDLRTDIREAMSNYQGSGMSMLELALYTVQCATFYGNNECMILPFEELSEELANEAWTKFKYFYLSMKQQIEYYYRDLYAIEEGCYNGCIGEDNFNPWELGFANTDQTSPHFDGGYYEDLPSEQPCHWTRAHFYRDKTKRFQREVGGYDFNDDPMQVLEEMVEQADYDMYLQTGRCPLSFDLEYLLNRMIQDNKLTANNISLFGVQEFTYDLYRAVSGLDPQSSPYVPYRWKSTITGNRLDINFVNGVTICDNISLILEEQSNLNWNTLGSTWEIVALEQLIYTEGNYNFAVLIKVDTDLTDQNNALIDLVLQGNTCLPIGNCDLAPVSCEENGITQELLDLLNILYAGDNLFNTSSESIYQQVLESGVIELYFSGEENEYLWRYDPANNGSFYLSNIEEDPQIILNLNAPLPDDILQFSELTTTDLGQLNLTILYRDDQQEIRQTNISCEITNMQGTYLITASCCKGNTSANTSLNEIFINGILSENLSSEDEIIVFNTAEDFAKPYVSQEFINSQLRSLPEGVLRVEVEYEEGNVFRTALIYEDENGNSADCSTQLRPFDLDADVDIRTLQYISNMIRANIPQEFLCQGHFANGETVPLRGITKCFILEDCESCPPPTPRPPITCESAY